MKRRANRRARHRGRVGIRSSSTRPAGLEPATHSLEGCCSIQLSYGRLIVLQQLRGLRQSGKAVVVPIVVSTGLAPELLLSGVQSGLQFQQLAQKPGCLLVMADLERLAFALG
jgi:hypothetical protein